MGNKIWRFLCLLPPDEDDNVMSEISQLRPVEEENKFRNEGGNDIDSVMNEISQHLNHIRQGEPTTENQQWPDHLSSLFKFLSTGENNSNNGSGFGNFKEALDIGIEVLDKIGASSLIFSGFLVISHGLKRVQDVKDNKEECFSVLEDMIFLNKIVKQCTERERLKKGMGDEIKDATKLIMEGTLTCLAQLKSSPFSNIINTSENKEQLTEIKGKIRKKYNAISLQMGFEILEDISKLSETPRLSRKYPDHAVGNGFESSVKEVADLLEWGTENKAVAVILYGFGGMGKTTLADAVFNRVNINSVNGEECKYSHVEMSKSIGSFPNIVELQKKILEDLLGRKNIPEIRKYQDGQKQIHDTLEKVPAFIYIDNVVEKDELRQLLPLNFEGAGKVRLLITSRDRNVRKACPMKTPPKEYRIRGISSGDARDLLKKQMSAAAPLGDEISSSVHRIIDRCGGIPLMLNLVVQELSSAKDKTEVHEVIQELEKSEGEEFGAKLDSYFFHYDRLPEVCKAPFLDICSFFKGWEWDTVGDIVGKTALDRLEHRSLMAKGKDGAVTVPDVIMKVGQRKAEEIRMRFTATSQLMNFLLDDEKVEQLRYLRYKPAKDWNQVITKKLKMPQNLKCMEIDGKLYCDNMEIFPTGLLRLQELRILRLLNFQEEKIFKDEGGIDIESIMNEISQHLNHVRQGEPTTVQFRQWPDRLSELFEFLSTGKNNSNNGSGFNNFTDALDIVQEVLDKIGSSNLIVSGFLVISYGLKRVQDVNDNKEECFSVLEDMNFLNKIVKQYTERERLKEGMQAEIRAATELIMNGTLMCLTQLKCSPFSNFCNTYGNTRQLTDIKRKIKEKYNDISFQMDFEIVDAVSALSKAPRLSRKYPNHADENKFRNEGGNDIYSVMNEISQRLIHIRQVITHLHIHHIYRNIAASWPPEYKL